MSATPDSNLRSSNDSSSSASAPLSTPSPCPFPSCDHGNSRLLQHVRHHILSRPAMAADPSDAYFAPLQAFLVRIQRWCCSGCHQLNQVSRSRSKCYRKLPTGICGCPPIAPLALPQFPPTLPLPAPPSSSGDPAALAAAVPALLEPLWTIPFVSQLFQHQSLRTVRQIPRSLRSRWARFLMDTISRITAHPADVESWLELFAMPVVLLHHPPRSHSRFIRSHQPPLAGILRARFDLWESGTPGQLSLIHSLPSDPLTPPIHQHDNHARNLQRCKRLVESGRLGDAVRSLGSRGLSAPTASNLQLLADLHPVSPVPVLSANDCPAFQPSQEEVLDALRSFPKDTACGSSGLRVTHLLDSFYSLTRMHGEDFLFSITSLIRLLLNGLLPVALAPLLTLSPLIALTKSNGALRPVAIGGRYFRWVTSSCSCGTGCHRPVSG